MNNDVMKKTPMPSQDPNVRNKNFDEVALGYTKEMAVGEAKRCLNCKNKPCVAGCPVNVRIPEFIEAVAAEDFEKAYEIITSTNSLPAICGRVCPQETQCESLCTLGVKFEPVGIGRLERFVADYHNENCKEAPAKPESNGHKVAVVGSGPSGLTCAGDLAKLGYDVTVYEKRKREDMGYDWTDIFDKKGLFAAGMEMPAEDKYKFKNDMTFYSPNMNVGLRQHVPQDQLEIQMERKEIYNHIISYAESCGVKFQYETEILHPVMLGDRVAGIQTDKETIYADLVIDAAGLNSVIRRNLPAHLGIQNDIQEYEQFYVYRAFFNKTAECDEDKFKLMLLHEGNQGIFWVAAEEEYTDALIGSFTPLTDEKVEKTMEYLRSKNPHLGDKIERGGCYANIPVRQPLGVMVADGYAAIGDSAYMTVPVIGSGIANSLKASRMLADAIMNDETDSFSAEVLWKYQRSYYKALGNGFAPLACVKLLLTRLDGDELDYIFDSGILNADDMTIGADSTDIGSILGGVTKDSLKKKLVGLKNNPVVLKKVLRTVKELSAAAAVTAAMPKTYNRKAVCAWVKQYNNCFKH